MHSLVKGHLLDLHGSFVGGNRKKNGRSLPYV